MRSEWETRGGRRGGEEERVEVDAQSQCSVLSAVLLCSSPLLSSPRHTPLLPSYFNSSPPPPSSVGSTRRPFKSPHCIASLHISSSLPLHLNIPPLPYTSPSNECLL